MTDTTPTRQRLLDAALALVIEDGIQAVTHRRVEEKAGAARGSTRYHFGAREDLLAALVGHLAARDHDLVTQALQTIPGPVGHADAAQLQTALQGLVQAMLHDRDGALARFELHLYAARRPELREVVAGWGESFTAVGAQGLGAGEAAHTEAALLVAALDGLVLHALASPEPARDRRAASWFAELVNARRT